MVRSVNSLILKNAEFRKFIKGIMFLWIEKYYVYVDILNFSIFPLNIGQLLLFIAPALYMIHNPRWPSKNKDGFTFHLNIKAFSCDI